jgi:Uroporphyrinogen decarboxylase (URO-D)
MTPRERVMATLNLQQVDKIPFIDWFDPSMRSEVAILKGASPEINDARFARLVGMDAFCMENYDKYLPPVFCETIQGSDGREHLQGEGLIQTRKDLDKMIFPDLKDEAYFDDAKRFMEMYGKEDMALFAVFRTGMMNTVFSMGMMGFSVGLYEDIQLVETVIDRYTEWTCTVLQRLQPLGFDFVMSFDDIAYNSGPIFSPDTLRELFLPRIQPIIDVIKLPWAYHSDGDLSMVMGDLVSLGMNAINPFQPDVMDIKAMKEKYGDKIAVWGNIDLHYTLTRGTTEEVKAEVKQRIEEVGPGGGYIISSANSLTDYCKPENVIAMIDTINKYREYPISID